MNFKIVVSIFCILIIIAGFSFSAFAEQNKKILITESRLLDADVVSYEVIPDIDANALSSFCLSDTLDQQQTVDSGFSWAVSENGYYAQSFIPTLGQLTRVELKLFKQGAPSGLTVSIRSDLTSPDLTSKYLPASSIPTSVAWIEFNFPDISVTPGNTYYIFWDPVGVPDFNNNFYWRVGTGNPYLNGTAWDNLGSGWETFNPSQSPNPDFCFKTYGYPAGNNPPNTPNTPSGPTSGGIGTSYSYSTSGTDPDSDQVKYCFDWGDGSPNSWTSLVSSGNTGSASHAWSTSGTFQVKAKSQDEHGSESGWSSALTVTISTANNPPNKPSTPSGPSSGKPANSYSYSSSVIDPDGDQVYLMFDWGDGTNTGWRGPFNSGSVDTESHVWVVKGSYSVKVQAKDTKDALSVWSDPLPVTMPYSYNNLTLKFLEVLFQRFPHAFPVLRQLMGY